MTRLITAALLACPLVGCAAPHKQLYTGLRLPVEKEVRVTTERGEQIHYCAFIEADKERLYDPAMMISGDVAGYPSTLYLPPGRHSLVVKCEYVNKYAGAALWFDGEPGKAYVLRWSGDAWSMRVWLADATSGEPVGGVGDPPPLP